MVIEEFWVELSTGDDPMEIVEDCVDLSSVDVSMLIIERWVDLSPNMTWIVTLALLVTSKSGAVVAVITLFDCAEDTFSLTVNVRLTTGMKSSVMVSCVIFN